MVQLDTTTDVKPWTVEASMYTPFEVVTALNFDCK